MTDNRSHLGGVALEDIPGLGILFETGQRGPIFDGLILLAIPLFTVVALVGRSPATVGLMAGYVSVFLATVGVRAIRGRDDQ